MRLSTVNDPIHETVENGTFCGQNDRGHNILRHFIFLSSSLRKNVLWMEGGFDPRPYPPNMMTMRDYF